MKGMVGIYETMILCESPCYTFETIKYALNLYFFVPSCVLLFT